MSARSPTAATPAAAAPVTVRAVGRTPRRMAAVLLLAGVAVTGCGDDEPSPDRDDRGPAATTSTSGEPSTTAAPTDSAPMDSAPSDSAPSAPVGCERLGESPDGVYEFESGRVTVTRTGDRLGLADVQPAEGWTHVVDDVGDDDIEIDFRRAADGRHVEFEADLDDGVLDIEICADR